MHKRTRLALAATAAAALTSGLLAATAGTASAAGSGLQGDFNGDGYRDVAVSAPAAGVGGQANAGQIVILYGSAKGLSAAKHQTISENTTGVPGSAQKSANFGGTTATADFNADGYADLAVGTAYQDSGGKTDTGTVTILWGSASGLSGGTTVKDPKPAKNRWFGRSLAAADFNGDGKADLAVGSTGNAINVYRGGFTKSGGTGGYSTVTAPIVSGGSAGAYTLTAGDVTGDGKADLVVDGFDPKSTNQWNANYFLPGSAAGLKASGAKKLPAGLISAIGDLDGDGYGDIVIGLQWDASTGVPGAVKGGKVNIIYGSASGPSSRTTAITQNTTGVPDSSESNDNFGNELALGDINGDGHLDLAIGAEGETLGGKKSTGAVTVIYGSAKGLKPSTGAQFFNQNRAGVPDTDETGDRFGSDVLLSDVTGDGKADLTIGAFGEDGYDGAVYALRSDGTRITTSGAAAIHPSGVSVSTSGTPAFGVNFAG